MRRSASTTSQPDSGATDHFRFTLVVLNYANIYGKPFAVHLILQELEHRTRTKRIQFQVNLWNTKDAQGAVSDCVII